MFYYCTMFRAVLQAPAKRKPLLPVLQWPHKTHKGGLPHDFFPAEKDRAAPLVTVREVYDKTCAVERAVGELQRTLDGRAAQRSHVLRYLGIAAVLTPLFWRLETYALGCRWLVSSGIIRDTVQVVTPPFPSRSGWDSCCWTSRGRGCGAGSLRAPSPSGSAGKERTKAAAQAVRRPW